MGQDNEKKKVGICSLLCFGVFVDEPSLKMHGSDRRNMVWRIPNTEFIENNMQIEYIEVCRCPQEKKKCKKNGD